MGVNGPDSNAVQGFNKLWQEASVHNVEKGQTCGINKEEFDGMSLFLNDAINNENSSDETKQWARQKLNDLDTMKNSVFNVKNRNTDIEAASPEGVLNKLKDFFTKTEKDYYEENVISYETMLVYNGGGIDAIRERDSEILKKEFGDIPMGFMEYSIFNFSENKTKNK